MERAIVTVKRQGEAWVRDLEVPTDVEAKRLVELIAEALRLKTDAAGQPMEYELETHPPGRKLNSDETLENAGVWDGAWLILKPVGQIAPAPPPPPTQPNGPVVGWRSLDVDLPAQTSSQEPCAGQSAPQASKHEIGFVWKQID